MRYDERRTAAVALVLGPGLFLAANIIHPKELAPGDGNEAEQLGEIAEHYSRWQFAHFLTFAAIVVLAAAVVSLALLVWRRNELLGVAGGALGLAGLMGLTGWLALDGFAWGIVGEVSARPGFDGRTAEEVLNDLQTSEWGLQFYLMSVAWILGMLVLALGLVRTGLVPTWAGAALGFGALAVGLESVVRSNTWFIIVSAVFLASGIAVAATLRESPQPVP